MPDPVKKTMSQSALIEDPDVESIDIRVHLKAGVNIVSPFTIERAVLKWMAAHFPAWAEYWMKPGSTIGTTEPRIQPAAAGSDEDG